MARSVWVAAIALCAASATSALPGASGAEAPNERARTATVAGCALPPLPEEASDGIPASAEWRSTDAAEAALSRVAVASIEWFGDPENDNWIQLRNGYVGVIPNDVEQAVVIVLDASASERASYQSKFQAVAGDNLDVEVAQSCHPAERLAAAADALPALRKNNPGSAFAADIDVATSTIRVWHYAKTQAARADFRAATDDGLVDVIPLSAPPVRDSGGRTDDAQPHWGGARITNRRNGSRCTSGFAIDTAQAGKAIVTAGHCGRVDDRFDSGTHAYGPVTRRGNFPARDMMIINGDNQNYDDDIYMNPILAVGNPIDVSGTRVVEQGNHVCLSGAFSHTTCDLTVNGVHGVICDDAGCTDNLIRYDAANGVCRPGDSGSPVFSRTNGTPRTALVTGMHIAELPSTDDFPGCFAHKFTEIQNAFNVTVATSP